MKTPSGETLHIKLAAIVADEEDIQAGEEFWMVIPVVGGYRAAWIDEAGEMHMQDKGSRAKAILTASNSWGR